MLSAAASQPRVPRAVWRTTISGGAAITASMASSRPSSSSTGRVSMLGPCTIRAPRRSNSPACSSQRRSAVIPTVQPARGEGSIRRLCPARVSRGFPLADRCVSGAGEDLLQQADGAGLVEGLVEVAALGGLDAGRAAVGALAAPEGVEGGVEVAVGGLVAQIGDAGPARVAVVDGDRGQAGVDLVHRRHPADV